MLALINKKTGEQIDITMAKKVILQKVKDMSDEEKAFYFPQLNFARKTIATFETAIKDYIKSQNLNFGDDKKTEWKGITVKKRISYRFDAEKFRKNATNEEKKLLSDFKKMEEKVNEVKERYKSGVQSYAI